MTEGENNRDRVGGSARIRYRVEPQSQTGEAQRERASQPLAPSRQVEGERRVPKALTERRSRDSSYRASGGNEFGSGDRTRGAAAIVPARQERTRNAPREERRAPRQQEQPRQPQQRPIETRGRGDAPQPRTQTRRAEASAAPRTRNQGGPAAWSERGAVGPIAGAAGWEAEAPWQGAGWGDSVERPTPSFERRESFFPDLENPARGRSYFEGSSVAGGRSWYAPEERAQSAPQENIFTGAGSVLDGSSIRGLSEGEGWGSGGPVQLVGANTPAREVGGLIGVGGLVTPKGEGVSVSGPLEFPVGISDLALPFGRNRQKRESRGRGTIPPTPPEDIYPYVNEALRAAQASRQHPQIVVTTNRWARTRAGQSVVMYGPDTISYNERPAPAQVPPGRERTDNTTQVVVAEGTGNEQYSGIFGRFTMPHIGAIVEEMRARQDATASSDAQAAVLPSSGAAEQIAEDSPDWGGKVTTQRRWEPILGDPLTTTRDAAPSLGEARERVRAVDPDDDVARATPKLPRTEMRTGQAPPLAPRGTAGTRARLRHEEEVAIGRAQPGRDDLLIPERTVKAPLLGQRRDTSALGGTGRNPSQAIPILRLGGVEVRVSVEEGGVRGGEGQQTTQQGIREESTSATPAPGGNGRDGDGGGGRGPTGFSEESEDRNNEQGPPERSVQQRLVAEQVARDLVRLGEITPLVEDGDSLALQIALQLAQKIDDGDLSQGKKMPGTNSIAQAFGVSEKTVQEANKLLVEGNYITTGRRFNLAGPRSPEVEELLELSPRAVELFEELETRITDGTYSEGQKLPTSVEIGEELKSYRETVNEAMRLLIKRGHVVDRGTHGRYVNPTEGELGVIVSTRMTPERAAAIEYIRNLPLGRVMPSRAIIVEQTGLSDMEIRLAIRDLQRLGEIGQRGAGKSPIYRGREFRTKFINEYNGNPFLTREEVMTALRDENPILFIDNIIKTTDRTPEFPDEPVALVAFIRTLSTRTEGRRLPSSERSNIGLFTAAYQDEQGELSGVQSIVLRRLARLIIVHGLRLNMQLSQQQEIFLQAAPLILGELAQLQDMNLYNSDSIVWHNSPETARRMFEEYESNSLISRSDITRLLRYPYVEHRILQFIADIKRLQLEPTEMVSRGLEVIKRALWASTGTEKDPSDSIAVMEDAFFDSQRTHIGQFVNHTTLYRLCFISSTPGAAERLIQRHLQRCEEVREIFQNDPQVSDEVIEYYSRYAGTRAKVIAEITAYKTRYTDVWAQVKGNDPTNEINPDLDEETFKTVAGLFPTNITYGTSLWLSRYPIVKDHQQVAFMSSLKRLSELDRQAVHLVFRIPLSEGVTPLPRYEIEEGLRTNNLSEYTRNLIRSRFGPERLWEMSDPFILKDYIARTLRKKIDTLDRGFERYVQLMSETFDLEISGRTHKTHGETIVRERESVEAGTIDPGIIIEDRDQLRILLENLDPLDLQAVQVVFGISWLTGEKTYMRQHELERRLREQGRMADEQILDEYVRETIFPRIRQQSEQSDEN